MLHGWNVLVNRSLTNSQVNISSQDIRIFEAALVTVECKLTEAERLPRTGLTMRALFFGAVLVRKGGVGELSRAKSMLGVMGGSSNS